MHDIAGRARCAKFGRLDGGLGPGYAQALSDYRARVTSRGTLMKLSTVSRSLLREC